MADRRGGRGRGSIAVVGLGFLILLVVALAGTRGTPGTAPLDPTSVRPDGAKAIATTMRRVGADVRASGALPDAANGRALVLVDDLPPAQRRRIDEWVHAGGVLVLADLTGSLAHDLAPDLELGPVTDGTVSAGTCTLSVLDRLTTIDPPASSLIVVRPDDRSCFGRPAASAPGSTPAAFVVSRAEGAGTLVLVASAELWRNDRVGQADNAALAATLAGAGPGRVVTFVLPSAGEGTVGLAGLIDPRVWQGIAEAGVAFVVLAMAAGRRLGSPVAEVMPVTIEGSELVAAGGRLLQRARRPGRAGALIQDAFRRELAVAVGEAPHAPSAVLAAAAERVGLDPVVVAGVLDAGRTGTADTPELTPELTLDDAGLVRLARSVDDLRRALRPRTPAAVTDPDPMRASKRAEVVGP